MSSIDQIPDAVVADVSEISGMWPWCTVTTSRSVGSKNSMNASAPVITFPPASVVSITTSSAKTWRIPPQSFVSIVRKYRAFSCLIASRSSTTPGRSEHADAGGFVALAPLFLRHAGDVDVGGQAPEGADGRLLL